MEVEQGHQLKLLQNGGWDGRIEIIEVGGFVRSHIIYSLNFTLVYDTLLGPLSGTYLLERVRQRAPNTPLRVVVSHSDWDHCWGNQIFEEPIHASPLCAERMMGPIGAQELKEKRKEHSSYEAVRLVAPTLPVHGGEVWDGGDLSVHFLHTPGHRPDHLALYIPEIRTLLPGDAVETPFCLVDDLEPRENLLKIQETLRQLSALETDWLLCNHAPPQQSNLLVRENLKYYQQLSLKAQSCDSLENLLEQFPYPGPADQEFYRKDHERICRQSWTAFH